MAERLLPRHKPTQQGTGAFNAALAAAKAEFPDIPRRRVATVKMKSGGSYSYNYADLADVIRAVTPALSAYGLAFMQWPDGSDVVTWIGHETGQEKTTRWPIKPMPARGMEDAQSFQAAMQVAKRYALQAALGISTEETLEGDFSRARGDAGNLSQNFETGNGIRMPRGATWDPKASKEENARAAADAIIEQFKEPKTKAGVNGVWNHNEMFIGLFDERYPELYQDVLDAFSEQMEAREA